MIKNFTPCIDISYVHFNGDRLRRTVVCAANRREDGLIVCGARHWDEVMRNAADAISPSDFGGNTLSWAISEQGFIDQWGNFMTREQAAVVARNSGQILRNSDFTDELYSENLY